jgi:23S rRNA (guanosine2251-2'-O)-methyltransferase
VLELLEARRRTVSKVLMAAELDSSEQLDRIEELCRVNRVPLEVISRSRLDHQAATESHQGIVAKARALVPVELDDLIAPSSGPVPFLLVCDGVTDPHNLGSLLRSAECAGVTGVVLPRHRAARVTPTVSKVAAGAIEHLAFASVAGIPSALDRLAKAGVSVIGLAGEATGSIYDLELSDRPVALVIGSEEKGLAALSRRRCTSLAAIPQAGSIESLNASVAGAVAMFEVARQRTRS